MEHYLILALRLIENIAFYAGIFASFNLVKDWSLYVHKAFFQVLLGLFIGGTAALSMLTAIEYGDGIFVDSRFIILSLPGLFGGPVASIFSVIPPILLRIHMGGDGLYAGASMIILAALCSTLFGLYLKTNKKALTLENLVPYAVFISLITISFTAFIPNTHSTILRQFIPVFFLTNIIGILLLSSLLLLDEKRRRAKEDLYESIEKLQKESRISKTLLNIMNYEIRPPMNVIVGFADTLLQSDLNDHQAHYAKEIKLAGKNLSHLLNDIQILSNIEAGQTELTYNPMDLHAILQETAEAIKEDVENNNNKISISISKECPQWIYGDQKRYTQLLSCLLINAKYNAQNNEIRITADIKSKKQPDTLVLKISGPGVADIKENKDFILDPTQHNTFSTDKIHGDPQLALTIAYRLAELLGGKLQFYYEEGKEAAFMLEFTFKSVKDRNIKTEEPPALPSNVELKGRILLMESLTNNKDLLYAALLKEGYLIEFTSSEEQILQRIKEEDHRPINFLIIDDSSSEINPQNLSKTLRKTYGLSNDDLPILIVTQSTTLSDIKSYYESGMDDHCPPPLNDVLLIEKANEWISGQKKPPSHLNQSLDYNEASYLDETLLDQFISFMGKDKTIASFDFFQADFEKLLIRLENEGLTDELLEKLENASSTAENVGLLKLGLFLQNVQNYKQDNENRSELLPYLKSLAQDSFEQFIHYTA